MPETADRDLVDALLAHLDARGSDWETLAIAIDFRGREAGGTGAYLYGPAGFLQPGRLDTWEAGPAIKAWMEGAYPGPDWPAQILVQVDGATRACRVLVEETDPTRWRVRPGNLETIYEEMRPAF